MNKKLLLLTGLLALVSQFSYAEGADEAKKEKKFSISTGVTYKNRQNGMIGQKGYEYGQPDDFNENGDVTNFFTKLGYKINDKWSLGYKYGYKYVQDNEANGYGRYIDKNGNKQDGRNDGWEATNAVSLTRSFDDISMFGKDWSPKITGTYEYMDHSGYYTYDDTDNKTYGNDGYRRDRIILDANLASQLTDKTKMALDYTYQYRKYDYDNKSTNSYQQRHYLTVDVYHAITDKVYVDVKNTLYVKFYNTNSQNKGEFDYDYTLGYKTPIKDGIIFNPNINTWGELGLWQNGGASDVDHNQSEVVLYPLMFRKTFKINEDMNVSSFIGAGYTYGWDTQTGDTIYDGFEGKTGVVFNAKL